MPKFSIILPVRNGGEYARQCVNSILSQDYKDFNLHVLDNYSGDDLLPWLNSLNDSRIKIYPLEKPLTIEENWGRIKSIDKNEFMTLIGHDDLLDPCYLGTIDNLINRHPGASLYHTHFRYIDSNGQLLRHCKPMDKVELAPQFLASFLSNRIDSMGTGYMMRSVDYDESGGIPSYPNLLFADFELWIKLVVKGYKVTAAEECFSFRLHQSTTSLSADIKYYKAFEMFMKYLVQLKESNSTLAPVIEEHALAFIRAYCKGLTHRLLRTPKKKREGVTVKSFVALCKQYADRLVPGNHFHPYAQFNIRLANFIDSNPITRNLFLVFKKIYSKPIYS
jgi:glycosyltransferase involved in cell wall biosynthesis